MNRQSSKGIFIRKFLSIYTTYKPLIVILIFCLLLPALQFKSIGSEQFMYYFMGYFFIFLFLFKFFDLNGFAIGFAKYDCIAMRVKLYGYLYPFLEFLLGAAYLAQFILVATNLATTILMSIGAISVLKSILSKQKINCACLGTVLNVPLSTVSFLENFVMGAMAAYKLIGS